MVALSKTITEFPYYLVYFKAVKVTVPFCNPVNYFHTIQSISKPCLVPVSSHQKQGDFHTIQSISKPRSKTSSSNVRSIFPYYLVYFKALELVYKRKQVDVFPYYLVYFKAIGDWYGYFYFHDFHTIQSISKPNPWIQDKDPRA